MYYVRTGTISGRITTENATFTIYPNGLTRTIVKNIFPLRRDSSSGRSVY